jgi:predicted RNA binding protein YcfA (HicA-like mRNA interferase family)
MVREMQKAGWEIARIHGSHFNMKKGSETIVVSVHGNATLKPGLEHKIRKAAGI